MPPIRQSHRVKVYVTLVIFFVVALTITLAVTLTRDTKTNKTFGSSSSPPIDTKTTSSSSGTSGGSSSSSNNNNKSDDANSPTYVQSNATTLRPTISNTLLEDNSILPLFSFVSADFRVTFSPYFPPDVWTDTQIDIWQTATLAILEEDAYDLMMEMTVLRQTIVTGNIMKDLPHSSVRKVWLLEEYNETSSSSSLQIDFRLDVVNSSLSTEESSGVDSLNGNSNRNETYVWDVDDFASWLNNIMYLEHLEDYISELNNQTATNDSSYTLIEGITDIQVAALDGRNTTVVNQTKNPTMFPTPVPRITVGPTRRPTSIPHTKPPSLSPSPTPMPTSLQVTFSPTLTSSPNIVFPTLTPSRTNYLPTATPSLSLSIQTSSSSPSHISTSSSPSSEPTKFPSVQLQNITKWGSFELLRTVPHDTQAFTQGLLLVPGNSSQYFESTGLFGRSSLRRVDLETGQVLQRSDLSNRFFGEGLEYFQINSDTISPQQSLLIQLTWRAGVAFVYDADTFDLLEEHPISTTNGEGWGICRDSLSNDVFYVTDGTDNLHIWNISTLELIDKKAVTFREADPNDNFVSQNRLNELEFDYHSGTVLSNVWQQNFIVRLNPESGFITHRYDLSLLDQNPDADVLNGIAITAVPGEVWVTGKLWPEMYLIRLLDDD